ncbi:hypothetical protein [Methylobacterium sp. J-068]|uniref:hypothetical protein n=1 Tax=Methylobacterium sp. J-068 TaxID=2836649 RepID=UPI001FB9F328|nr:hypothetical protein [Methylobacterium sp. J-068]MCJ2034245.1 hypothetical protein [Methylobacterium sp. J-068]
MVFRIIAGLLVYLALCAGIHAEVPPSKAPGVPSSITLQPVAVYDAAGNVVGSFGGGSTTIAGVTRTRLTCTLPAYAAGGNIVCTDATGAQTTTACAASTACLVNAANANRKTAFFMNRTANTTIDIGYSASVAPGNSYGIDGPAAAGAQGGSTVESPAHVGAYYAASPAAATLVFIQGQ